MEKGGAGGLSLEQAVNACKLRETSAAQLKVITPTTEISAVKYTAKGSWAKKQNKSVKNSGDKCKRCGKAVHKAGEKCPARDYACNKCGRTGHWAAVCFTKPRKVEQVQQREVQSQAEESESFLGAVSKHSRGKSRGGIRQVRVVSGQFDKTMVFKVDTGADITVIPPMEGLPPLLEPDTSAFGPGNKGLTLLGFFRRS